MSKKRYEIGTANVFQGGDGGSVGYPPTGRVQDVARKVPAVLGGTSFTVSRFSGQGMLSGVLLRSAAHFPDTSLAEVAGCLRSKRKSKTPAEMRAAIGREVKRRHDRGRY
jgi:hypothetical protein